MTPKCCFVALIDLLGFSDVVYTGRLTVVANILRRFQAIARRATTEANHHRAQHGLHRVGKTRLRAFSDLILVHTTQDSQDECMDIIQVCSKLFRAAYEDGLLPRGAIAWGEMIISPTITVGCPLIEAHWLESRQEWSGITLCDSMSRWDCEEGYTEDKAATILDIMEKSHWLIKWDVPLKSGNKRRRLAINWLNFEQKPYRHKRFVEWECVHHPSEQIKLANTEEFYKYLITL